MHQKLIALSIGIILLQTPAAAASPGWPQFRGPSGLGVASDDQPGPVDFGPDKNVLWKVEVASGISSPCIVGNHVFITGFDVAKKSLETIALNRASGSVAWRQTAPAVEIERVHDIGSPAVATPVTDGTAVYVYFASYGLLAYDLQGKELWKKPLPMPVNPRGFGSGTSPVIVGELLILDVEEKQDSHLLAVRCVDGQTVWKASKPFSNYSYSTPVVWKEGGETVIGLQTSGRFAAYAAKDGAERWWVEGLPRQACATPACGDGWIILNGTGVLGEPSQVATPPSFDEVIAKYDLNKDGQVSPKELPQNLLAVDRQTSNGAGNMSLRQMLQTKDENQGLDRDAWEKMTERIQGFTKSAFMKTGVFALRVGGKGDVTTSHVLWSEQKGAPETPSPLIYRNRIFLVKSGGIATCREIATGKLIFEERLDAAGGYYASPVAAGGRIYTASDRGMVVVLKAGDTFDVLARNDFKEPIIASPALLDGILYVRTKNHFYALGKPSQ